MLSDERQQACQTLSKARKLVEMKKVLVQWLMRVSGVIAFPFMGGELRFASDDDYPGQCSKFVSSMPVVKSLPSHWSYDA